MQSVVLDGEGVLCGSDGIPDFEKLHSCVYDHQVCYFAFDLLELNGADLRELSLQERKAKLSKLLGKKSDIHYVEHLDDNGALIFEHACRMGLEGIVSKRRDMPYRSGRSKMWLKIKNPTSPAMLRLVEEEV